MYRMIKEFFKALWARRLKSFRGPLHTCKAEGCKNEAEYLVEWERVLSPAGKRKWKMETVTLFGTVCVEHLKKMQTDPKKYIIRRITPLDEPRQPDAA
ncbi:MAG: hypothetical protein JWN50_105 [Parcubacteria group bacterium]|nr:hypothetical protein [Parcubacteria group bacterium]